MTPALVKKVITYNNVGAAKNEFETSATTWGELQGELVQRGIRYQGMKVVDGKTQHSYESSSALLPTEDFVLFMVPNQVKSGSREEDANLIDRSGITWDEVDWNDPTIGVEEYTFKSHMDLAIARSRKAAAYLNAIGDFLEAKEQERSTDRDEDGDNDQEEEEDQYEDTEEVAQPTFGYVQPQLSDELRLLHDASIQIQRNMAAAGE